MPEVYYVFASGRGFMGRHGTWNSIPKNLKEFERFEAIEWCREKQSHAFEGDVQYIPVREDDIMRVIAE